MADSTYKYLDQDGLARFKSKIQDILDTKVDKETGKYIVTVDESLSTTSNNPVRNSAVTVALNGKLGTSGDSKDNTVTFTTGDVANDAAATSWTADVGTISSGLSHANLFNRLSLEVKNLRYLKNLLGSTDISAIGGGTVTGALSKLNTDVASVKALTNGDLLSWAESLSDGFYTFRTNNAVTNTPVEYCQGYVISRNGNIRIIAHDMFSMRTYSTYKRSNTTWIVWTKQTTETELKPALKTFSFITGTTEISSILDYIKYQVNTLNEKAGCFFAAGTSSGVPTSDPYFIKYQSDPSASNQIVIEAVNYVDAQTRYTAAIHRSNTTSISWTKMPTRAEVDQLNTDLTPLNKKIQSFVITSSTPKTITCAGYNSAILLGFAQSIGSVAIAIMKEASNIYAINLRTGDTFQSNYLTITGDANSITITSTSTSSGGSTFTILFGGQAFP